MNKTAIITGASGGIGEAIALELDKKGYNLIINYNTNKDAAQKLCSSLKSAVPFKADVKNINEAQVLADKAFSLFGGIDLLVNNAGVALTALFQDFSE